MDKTWFYHYDPETKQQSITGGIVAHSAPKLPSAKIRWKSSRLDFLGSRSILLVDYLPKAKLPTRSITHLCWCNWRTFWWKNAAGSSPRWSCSCTTLPQLTDYLYPRRNWPTWASIVLITHPILWIWPRPTTACYLDFWKVTIFRPTRKSLLPRRPS